MLNKIKFYIFLKRLKSFGVRGLISRHEGEFLFNCALNSNCTVEIGSFQGFSTLILAYATKIKNNLPITAIDPHQGLFLDGKNIDTYEIFLKNIKEFNLEKYIDVERTTSAKASKSWNHKIYFLWIDGDHDYEAVKIDYTLWEPRVIKGGIIAFHDAGKNGLSWPGPRKLVDEIELSNKFMPFQYVEGIAWAIKK